MYSVAVQPQDFDVQQVLATLPQDTTGALVSFVGVVRGTGIRALELEHYPGMTEKALQSIVQTAQKRFDIQAACIVHRVGLLPLGANIVLVAVASAHRHAAFQACEWMMDYLKTQAPFWKKEHLTNGTTHWVDTRQSDAEAQLRWEATQKRPVV